MNDADITEEDKAVASYLLRQVTAAAEPPPVEETLRRLRADLARRDRLARLIRTVWRRLAKKPQPALVRARPLPVELEVLAIANRFAANDPDQGSTGWFYAYEMAKYVAQSGGKSLTRLGTLHRVLTEMERKSWIERAPADATAERPAVARRPYRITPNGQWALEREVLAVRDGVRSYGRRNLLVLEAQSPWGWS